MEVVGAAANALFAVGQDRGRVQRIERKMAAGGSLPWCSSAQSFASALRYGPPGANRLVTDASYQKPLKA